MDEPNSVFSAVVGTDSEPVLALSWNIATEPLLCRKLASNPYTPGALQIIMDKFPDQKTADVIEAVILAEPEGKYDRSFALLSKEQQENELRRQKETEGITQKQLVRYLKKNSKELTQVSKEIVYDRLSIVVFGTDNLKEIEDRFSQNQRRDFKLTIVNFIENRQKLSEANPQVDPVADRFLLSLAFAAISLVFFQFIIQNQVLVPVQEGIAGADKQVLAAGTQSAAQGFPVRLKIPSINVDAAVELVGVSSSGAMDVPKKTADVGWFNLGPRPGEKGSAVIAGHFNGIYGEDTVFTNLDKLKVGDKIFVEDDKGATISFVVRESRVYDPGYAEDVFSSNDGVYLNLITCDGIWDGAKKSFSKRLVVFADIAN